MSSPASRTLAAILHADVAGYSRLMGADEEGTVERLSEYRGVMTSCIDRHGGHVVDMAGDSLLAQFSSVVAATRCALELQDELNSRNAAIPAERRLDFRMGIEVADIITRDDAVYGDGVNVAARIQALAKPGGLCVSDAVRRAVTNRLPVVFEALGEVPVKNIEEPVKVFRVVTGAADAVVSAKPEMGERAGQRTPWWIAGALTVAVVLLASWLLYGNFRSSTAPGHAEAIATQPEDKAATAPAADEKPSIAVLPFINMSGDKEQEYFSDGISEDIIIDLSRVSNLQVIARNSSFSYRGQSVKPEEVGRDLGVRYVLSGSVRKAGKRIRVTAQLVDSQDSHQLWGEKFDRRLEDIFAVQDEITSKIVSALVIQLSSREQEDIALKATLNDEAYDFFLRAQQAARLGTKDGLARAAELSRQAIKLDPRFGRAYGMLAFSLTRSMLRGFMERSPQQLDQALELAKQAVTLSRNSPQTYWVLAYVHLRRSEYELALEAAQRSVEVAPNFADGYAILASINNHMDRGEEPVRLINRAIALNPLFTWEYPMILGRAYYNLGRYEQAAAQFQDALARNEYTGTPRVFLISSFVRLGRLNDARWEVSQLGVFNPEMTRSQIALQGRLRDKEKLRAFIADLETAGVAP